MYSYRKSKIDRVTMGVQGKRALAFDDRYRHSNAGNWYIDSSNQNSDQNR